MTKAFLTVEEYWHAQSRKIITKPRRAFGKMTMMHEIQVTAPDGRTYNIPCDW